MRRLLTALLWLPALTACASQTYFNKPGATQADLDRDGFECQRDAAMAYPVAMNQVQVLPASTSPVQTTCSGFGNMVSCNSTGGNYTPPTMMAVDYSRADRETAALQCMSGKGWSLTDENGNPVR